MRKKTLLSLDGIWRLKGCAPNDTTNSLSLEGKVPGHVHMDLLGAGEIRHPFWRDQAEECQWVEDWNWAYSRDFILDDDFDLSWTVLEFQGLDTLAHICLNGKAIGDTNNMFIPHAFDVSDILQKGINRLDVQFAPVGTVLHSKHPDEYPACFSVDRIFIRKMQCAFGWDWVHRFVSTGIWRPVFLHSYDTAFIKDVYVSTKEITGSSALLKISMDIERRTSTQLSSTIEIADPAGSIVWSDKVEFNNHAVEIDADIPHPDLWWPNGYGDPALYVCNVKIFGDGRELDGKDVEFGIRTVALEEIDDAAGSSFTLIVNGERIFCKGANWVPADPFPSEITANRYDHLIRLAADANMNLLRCWGGGVYEPDEFWRACNRYGIMVSQDFLLACAAYPEDDAEFVQGLRDEFSAAIKMLRNHPSLMWWSGDNELGMFYSPDSSYPGKRIADEISGPLCSKLDPSRPFRSTSPYGGETNNSLASGDCHASAWYSPEMISSDMQDYKHRIDQVIGRFMSEYAICGATSRQSLLKFMSEEDIADPSGKMWEYHTNDNPYSEIDLSHYRCLERTAELLFGKCTDSDTNVWRMEYVQYEWIRLVMESARRKKFYCSGVQFWMYNDCWPASGWSIVDYYGCPKAGYYAMKRSSQPVIASIEDSGNKFKIWICNDLRHSVDAKIVVYVQPWTGAPVWSEDLQISVPPNQSLTVAEISKSSLNGFLNYDNVMVCNLTWARGSDRAFYYVGMPHQMKIPPAELRTTRKYDSETSGEIVVSADSYARVVTLSGDAVFSDNYFDLLPCEEKTVHWHSLPGEKSGLPMSETCWNSVIKRK